MGMLGMLTKNLIRHPIVWLNHKWLGFKGVPSVKMLTLGPYTSHSRGVQTCVALKMGAGFDSMCYPLPISCST